MTLLRVALRNSPAKLRHAPDIQVDCNFLIVFLRRILTIQPVRQNRRRESGVFTPRVLFAFSLSAIGVLLALFTFSANPTNAMDQRTLWPGKTADTRPEKELSIPTTSGWSIVPSPNVNDGGRISALEDVACISASDCWAVGTHQLPTDYN